MSLSRVEQLDAQLVAWRVSFESGTEPDDAEARAWNEARRELREIVHRQEGPGGDRVVEAAAKAALSHDEAERNRIDFVRQMGVNDAERAKKKAHVAARPQRWAELPPEVRAAYRAAEVAPRALRAAFFKFVEALISKEPGEPSPLFEPVRIPGVDLEPVDNFTTKGSY